MNTETTQPEKGNILGYTQTEMNSSKPRSKYFVGLAFIFLVVIAFTNTYTGVVPMLIFMLVATVMAQILAWVARIVAKLLGYKINRFDCFATTYVILTGLALLSVFVPV